MASGSASCSSSPGSSTRLGREVAARAGAVTVGWCTETRRGRQQKKGDVVAVGGRRSGWSDAGQARSPASSGRGGRSPSPPTRRGGTAGDRRATGRPGPRRRRSLWRHGPPNQLGPLQTQPLVLSDVHEHRRQAGQVVVQRRQRARQSRRVGLLTLPAQQRRSATGRRLGRPPPWPASGARGDGPTVPVTSRSTAARSALRCE